MYVDIISGHFGSLERLSFKKYVLHNIENS